jgi:hypothetical protein
MSALAKLTAAAEQLRAQAGIGDEDVLAQLLMTYAHQSRMFVGLAACHRCGRDDTFGVGYFHERYYTASCRLCNYINIRTLPTPDSPLWSVQQ